MDLDELAQKAGLMRQGGGMRDNGEYCHYYEAWPEDLAALVNEVLEEAAKTCDPTEEPHDYRYDPMAVYEALQGCAAKIRSLKLNYPLADKRK